jgi:epoxyqueuosine reductase
LKRSYPFHLKEELGKDVPGAEAEMARGSSVEDLRGILEEFVAGYARSAGISGWWRRPLLAAAKADDRFRVLPAIASPEHALPWDLLPDARSVIVYFLPFRKDLARENREGATPCRDWGVAYVETNELIGRIGERLSGFLEERGHRCAVTPATHNFDSVKLSSRWSHKHLGHLCGLGRFGHNAQLITPSGCTGRLGSMVTEAELGDHPVMYSEEACLHKAGRECLKCVQRCPADALRREGLDRTRCWERLQANRRDCEALAGLPETTHVCGKCVVMLPCSFGNPVKK